MLDQVASAHQPESIIKSAEVQKNRLTSSPIASSHTFYLYDNIGGPSDYIDLVKALRSASEHDTFTIYINCYGGRVDSTIQILSAMKDCRAPITCKAEGVVMSAATFIFLAGDKHEVSDYCEFMFHNYSGGTFGKAHEMKAAVLGSDKVFSQMMKESYHDFLTEKEVDQLIDGKDFYFTSDEIRERLVKRSQSQAFN